MESVIEYVVGVLVIVLGLALSIGLHEIGHLVPAKRFGVKVSQWMIGFGPSIWSRRFGETEYGIKAIPLGGYISMLGMYPPAGADGRPRDANTSVFDSMVQEEAPGDDEPEDRMFFRLSWWKRVIVMLGGPVMNLLIAVVIITVLLCAIGAQTASTTLASVSTCLPSSLSSSGGGCDGAAVSPAKVAGFEAGDELIAIDGTRVTSWTEVSSAIQGSLGRALTVTVKRDGATRELTVTPAAATATSSSGTTTKTVGAIGITPTAVYQPQPVTVVPRVVGAAIGQVVGVVVTLPSKVYTLAVSTFTGAKRDPNGLVGVVGIGRVAGETAASNTPLLDRVMTLLSLIASLNLALFVFNLIPLLPLDGGHILGALWDALRGGLARVRRRTVPRPVDITRLAPLTTVVAVVLIGLTALLVLADIVNPVSLG